jgi:hypothetical protein
MTGPLWRAIQRFAFLLFTSGSRTANFIAIGRQIEGEGTRWSFSSSIGFS